MSLSDDRTTRVLTVVSEGDGTYQFDGLEAGVYSIDVGAGNERVPEQRGIAALYDARDTSKAVRDIMALLLDPASPVNK